ncbi:hypothetical protein DAPPUDRAFT_102481 [Daphnia pulex]|uniref:Uncharacterized protein n=1 Tax=Daphnia pulex TaxID=6669 RepID=E9GGJ6_DAPPU|nr:hypothetical protein DAPPUDRAFT_102481 [Daphnia pulex]|eukprot:EFX81407.1 hypothetical protein DAPPUDRAFT_102481 [Daphnia pulex]
MIDPGFQRQSQSMDSTIPAPSSMSIVRCSNLRRRLDSTARAPTIPSEGDIEKYAQSNLKIHKKGSARICRSVIYSWFKNPIRFHQQADGYVGRQDAEEGVAYILVYKWMIRYSTTPVHPVTGKRSGDQNLRIAIILPILHSHSPFELWRHSVAISATML